MRRWISVSLLLALLAAGCSGDDGDAFGVSPGEDGLEEVVRGGTEAVFAGDFSKAHSILTDECQSEWSASEIAAEITVGMLFAAGFLGVEVEDFKRMTVDEIIIDQFTAGSHATVRSSLVLDGEEFSGLDEDPTEYTYQGGRWRIVDCDFGDSGDGDDAGSEPSSEPDDGPGSRHDPLPSGEPFLLQVESFSTDSDGSQWNITVGAASDITDAVLEENEFVEPPDDGRLFLGVPVTVTYEGGGSEPLSFGWAIDISMFGPDSLRIFDGFDNDESCGFIEGELDSYVDLFPGGQESGIWCVQIPDTDVDGALLVFTAGDNLTYFATE